jgi:hypothetical protein
MASPAVGYAARVTARRRSEAPRRLPRKDRLIQTRVPRHVEETLKREARRRRVSVSQLIRNLLEDAFQLVDGVVADVDRIVADSVSLARNVGRRIGRGEGTGRAARRAPGGVYAWSEAVAPRRAACAGCGAAIARGRRAFVGLSDEAGAAPLWQCAACIGHLRDEADPEA